MILRILIPLFLLLSLPAWGIDRLSLRKHFGLKARMAFGLPNLLLMLWAVCLSVNESYTAAADYAKGLLLTLVLCIVVPECLLALFLGLGALLRRWKKAHRCAEVLAWCAGGASFAAMLFGSFWGYKQIHARQYVYQSAQLPEAFDGYRVVQISDLHLGTLHRDPAVVKRIVDSVNRCHPDLIVFTGDLVNYHARELDEFMPVLHRLQAKDGVISIMGNHDYMLYYRWPSEKARWANIRELQTKQRLMGWRLLLNENRVIRRDSDSIAVVGVENDGRPPFPSRGDLTKAQTGLQPGCFKLLLSHDPTHWRRRVLPETDIPLMLAGHTHGMQFKIGNFSPASWFYPEWGGPYAEGDQTLYVSLGVGEVLMPFRLGAWPEINIITLKHAK